MFGREGVMFGREGVVLRTGGDQTMTSHDSCGEPVNEDVIPPRPGRLFQPQSCLTSLLSFPPNNNLPSSLLYEDWGTQFVNSRFCECFSLASAKAEIRQLHERHSFLDFPGDRHNRAESPGDVPEVFFREDFDLREEGTFEEVFPAELFLGDSTRECLLLHDRAVREATQMAHLADVIEQQASQGMSSSRFVTAVVTHEEVQESIMGAQSFISKTRHELRMLDQALESELPPRLSCWCHEKTNLKALLRILRKIDSVRVSRPQIQKLLLKSDFVGVFATISSLKELFTNELTAVAALGNTSQHMASLSWSVESLLSDNFSQLCSQYFRGQSSLVEYKHKMTNYVTAYLYKRRMAFLRTVLREAQAVVDECHAEGEDEWIPRLERLMLTVVSTVNKFKTFVDFVSSLGDPGDEVMVVSHELSNHVVAKVGNFLGGLKLARMAVEDISTIHDILSFSIDNLQLLKVSSCLRFTASDLITKYVRERHEGEWAALSGVIAADRWRPTECPPQVVELLGLVEGGRSCSLPNSTVCLLDSVLSCLALVGHFPSLGTVVSLDCSDLIAKFNLRLHQVHSQMRKCPIQTAALCLNSVQLLSLLVDPLCGLFQRTSPNQQTATHFGKTKEELVTHLQELNVRIYDMISTPVIAEVRKWDRKEGSSMNSLMRGISQHLRKCQGVLGGVVSDHLIRLFETVNSEVMERDDDSCVAFIQGFRVEISQYFNT